MLTRGMAGGVVAAHPAAVAACYLQSRPLTPFHHPAPLHPRTFPNPRGPSLAPSCLAPRSWCSRRADPLAAWTNGLDLAAVVADTDRAFLILETGFNQRWRCALWRGCVLLLSNRLAVPSYMRCTCALCPVAGSHVARVH